MSTGAVASQAEPALLQRVAELLRQLVAGIEKVKQAHKPSALTAELALASTGLHQLQQWLPPNHALHKQLVKLHKLLPALLQPQEPLATVRLLAAVYLLQQRLLFAVPVELAAYRSHASAAAVVPLSQLWRWQQDTADNDTAAMIQPLLWSLLHQLVQVARTPVLAVADVGILLLRMQALLEFGATAEESCAFSELAQAVSLALLRTCLPSQAEQVHCWQALWNFVQQRHNPAACAAVCHDLELLQTAQLELGRYRQQLHMFLQLARSRPAMPALLSYPVLLLHYRLPWILAAVGQHSLAQLCQLWCQCLLVHWQHRMPVSAGLQTLWSCIPAVLDLSQWPRLSAGQICRWHLQLLQAWPVLPARPVEQVVFVGVREGEDESVPLAGIPERLAREFGLLTEQVTAEWFADATSYAPHAAALTAQLLLLEQGAAALKILAIESFCSQLLALHQKVRSAPLEQSFPADLLWRAHQHLRDMLDEITAWQEPVPDAEIGTAIKQWLQSVPELQQLPLPLADPAAAMLARVQSFVDSFARSVEQPLRFSVELCQALPESQLLLCEEALIALLRFLVLEQVQNQPQRRQALKPVAATLLLKLESTEDGIAVEITEAGVEMPPDTKTLKRLRHKLPEAVQRLYCRTVPGRGRSFRFVI